MKLQKSFNFKMIEQPEHNHSLKNHRQSAFHLELFPMLSLPKSEREQIFPNKDHGFLNAEKLPFFKSTHGHCWLVSVILNRVKRSPDTQRC